LISVQAQSIKNSTGDSAVIHTTITNFYNWYNKNYQKFNSYNLYTSIKTKDNPPYKINWKEADRYFNFVRTVPQLGEEFIKNLRIMLKASDSAFKVDLEDEIPYNFDYDWYTNSQEEPQWLIDELKKATQWATAVKGMDATVDVLGYYMEGNKKVETVVMCFQMKKEKGKWKIAKIGCAFAEEK
jgi:hypothetical protein